MRGKAGNCENRPTNVEVSKIFERSNSHIFISETCSNELINFQFILTHFCGAKIGKYCLGLKCTDKELRGYTYSRESGMKSSLLRYIYFYFLLT